MSRQRYALLGWPVAHSVSPQMQEAGFRALGIDASYELLPVPPAELAAQVEALRAAGYAGWNITVPHKQAMPALIDEVDAAARAAGSVNTVWRTGNRLRGYSTDGYGLAHATKEAFGIEVAGGRFLFWGTGGAARATAAFFAQEGATTIILVNRTVAKAVSLGKDLKELNPGCDIHVRTPADSGEIAAFVDGGVDVVYQCTSVGLQPDDPPAIPLTCLRGCRHLMDMIYHDTPVLRQARRIGCETADGRGMLLYQGVRSLCLWTGREAPVAAMRDALAAALSARSGK